MSFLLRHLAKALAPYLREENARQARLNGTAAGEAFIALIDSRFPREAV